MLLNDSDRAAALDAVVRHALPGARLVVDVRTAHLPWADRGPIEDERNLGRTVYRRKVTYSRTQECSTLVHWVTDVEQFGRVVSTAEEEFIVRSDTVDSLRELLGARGFKVEFLYGEYDLEHALRADDAVIVAVAHLE
jgi:hypothetical protein